MEEQAVLLAAALMANGETEKAETLTGERQCMSLPIRSAAECDEKQRGKYFCQDCDGTLYRTHLSWSNRLRILAGSSVRNRGVHAAFHARREADVSVMPLPKVH